MQLPCLIALLCFIQIIYHDYYSIRSTIQNLLLLKCSTAYHGYSVKYKFLCFLFLQQWKAGGRKIFVPREYVTINRKVRGGGEAEKLRRLKGVILLGNSFAHRQSFWLVGLALPVITSQTASFSYCPTIWKWRKRVMVNSVESEILSEHAVSHALQALKQNDEISRLSFLDYHFEDRESGICQQRSFNALLKPFLSLFKKLLNSFTHWILFTHFKPSNHIAKRSLATFMYVYDYHGKPREPGFNWPTHWILRSLR